MRSPRWALALCGGLLLTFAPDDRSQALGNPGTPTSLANKGAKRAKAPPRLRTPHELGTLPGQKLPFTAPSVDFGPGGPPTFASFSHRASYAIVSFAPNPLVSSPYKATPEYEFLYTPALISASPPPSRSYNYRADNGYLLRPSPAYLVAAWSYQWKRSTANQTAIRAIRNPPRLNAPAASRGAGQKIDNGLGARAMLPRDENGLWQPSTVLPDVQLGSVVPSVSPKR